MRLAQGDVLQSSVGISPLCCRAGQTSHPSVVIRLTSCGVCCCGAAVCSALTSYGQRPCPICHADVRSRAGGCCCTWYRRQVPLPLPVMPVSAQLQEPAVALGACDNCTPYVLCATHACHADVHVFAEACHVNLLQAASAPQLLPPLPARSASPATSLMGPAQGRGPRCPRSPHR